MQAFSGVPDVPFPLVASDTTAWRVTPHGLAGAAKPQSDIFISPEQGVSLSGPVTLNAALLLGEGPKGDFTLQAKVHACFTDTFDAGALIVWFDQRTWAKLCFERAPDGTPIVVSVVCRDISDDANAFPVEGNEVWLRIARIGKSFGFHASTDGIEWRFVRLFALGPGSTEPRIGFEVQSPVGQGCNVAFSDIGFERRTLNDPRDGT